MLAYDQGASHPSEWYTSSLWLPTTGFNLWCDFSQRLTHSKAHSKDTAHEGGEHFGRSIYWRELCKHVKISQIDVQHDFC